MAVSVVISNKELLRHFSCVRIYIFCTHGVYNKNPKLEMNKTPILTTNSELSLVSPQFPTWHSTFAERVDGTSITDSVSAYNRLG